MQNIICHIAPLGMNPDWIKEGLLYYDWNYLIILTTPQKEYIDLANKLKQELIPSYSLSDKRKLEPKLIKKIEIIRIKTRDVLEFIHIIKEKTRELKRLEYRIYFNATSGLELWRFSAYFLATVENLIDIFYYIPKDSDLNKPIKPIEIYLPVPLSEPLKNLLFLINSKNLSQKKIIKETGLSKGMISRYLKNLREIGLIEISSEKKGKERVFEITDKGKWFI